MTGRSVAADRFDRAVPIADTVLWEGYILYPYRASAAKNRLRFNWGVLGPAEGRTLASTVLVEADAGTVDIRVRFLHLMARDDGWDEAEPVAHDVSVDLLAVTAAPHRSPISVVSSIVTGDDGMVRRRRALDGFVEVSGTRTGDDVVLTVSVHNSTLCTETAPRELALQRSFVGCHVFLATDGHSFISTLEPPERLEGVARELEQHRAWPVLVGPPPARDLVLVSPVILYDYPAVAAQSVGDFYDGTEIDEMLALRVHTLTPDEKAEARALDPKAKAIIDRHDVLEPDVMAGLHGVIDGPGRGAGGAGPIDPNPEWSDPGPDSALVGGCWIGAGSKVRLEPTKRADVHDMFLRGRVATVAQIVHDVDGEVHVAVTVDDDPGADLFEAERRFLYFGPDELSPIGRES